VSAIAARGVSKAYGAVQALKDADFAADAGEVHALVGENGAGKSTLIKVLTGVVSPDAGIVSIADEEVSLRSPEDAFARGVGTVFQELTLLPWMTVAENLLLGREPRGPGRLIRRAALPERAEAILREHDADRIDPRALVADLSLADRQVLEIVHAISREPRVLFLDEPTSALARRGVEWLFGLVDRQRERGTCIVFTSHRWGEVKAIADRITVFRNGTHVATRTELSEEDAVTLMTGRRIEATARPEAASAAGRGEVVLEARDLTGPSVHGVSFAAHRGEVLGIAGLDGQGQLELFELLFGVRRPTGGELRLDGRAARLSGPRAAIHAHPSVALVPEDRGSGLLLNMSIKENLTLPVLDRMSTGGVVRRGEERAAVARTVERLRVKARDADQPIGTLSGGNQQKVLIGRWLLADAQVLLFYDVTRGVDVGTKEDLYALVAELAREGRTVVFYSTDTEEMARVAHRALVMREGRIVAELEGAEIEAEALVAAAVRDPGEVEHGQRR
jgi:ribose transport system ATP-binding protein